MYMTKNDPPKPYKNALKGVFFHASIPPQRTSISTDIPPQRTSPTDLYTPYQIGQFYRFNFFIGVELKQKKIEITIFQ